MVSSRGPAGRADGSGSLACHSDPQCSKWKQLEDHQVPRSAEQWRSGGLLIRQGSMAWVFAIKKEHELFSLLWVRPQITQLRVLLTGSEKSVKFRLSRGLLPPGTTNPLRPSSGFFMSSLKVVPVALSAFRTNRDGQQPGVAE